MSLTNKQRAFIDEYLKDWNATQAAIRAGYSKRSAYSIGVENLSKPVISEEIQRRIAERAMSADEVLDRLGQQAKGDISDFIDVVGRLAVINLEKAEQAGKLHLIKKLKYNASGAPEIELYYAQAALVQMGKQYGLFTDKVDNTGDITIHVRYESDSNA